MTQIITDIKVSGYDSDRFMSLAYKRKILENCKNSEAYNIDAVY